MLGHSFPTRRSSDPARASIALRASEEGHLIGNHTFTHSIPLGELDSDAAVQEFERAEQALDWLDQPQRLFRPYGRKGKLGHHLLNPAVVEKLCAGGYSCVLWNFVSGDWEDPDGWMARALADCRTRAWSLVVLHDLPSGAMKHLARFLQCLKHDGVEITQEPPPECVPILNGKIVLPIDEFLSY